MCFLQAGGKEERQEMFTLQGNECCGKSTAQEETLNWVPVVRDDFRLQVRVY